MNNPLILNVPAHTSCTLNPRAYSEHNRQSLVSSIVGGAVYTTFQGTGMNVAMTDANGGTTITYPPAAVAQQLRLVFNWSEYGTGPPIACKYLYENNVGPQTKIIYAEDYPEGAPQDDKQVLTVLFQ